MESPSSINIFKQCRRKYYYQYIEKIPTGTNIHLVRGKAVHSVLEEFFELNPEMLSEHGYTGEIKFLLFDLFQKHWGNSMEELMSLGLSDEELKHYYEESKTMVGLWAERFLKKMELEVLGVGVVEGFNKLKPKTELQYSSKYYGVRGYVDAIHEKDEIVLIDYKTSNKDYMSDDYKLQLAIYALLYKEKHGVSPDKVGIDFLRFGEVVVNVDESLLLLAKRGIASVHSQTKSEDINDYPKTITRLCKWSTGQCDFFDVCFKNEDYIYG